VDLVKKDQQLITYNNVNRNKGKYCCPFLPFSHNHKTEIKNNFILKRTPMCTPINNIFDWKCLLHDSSNCKIKIL